MSNYKDDLKEMMSAIVAKCRKEGFPLNDYHAAHYKELELHPAAPLSEVIQRTFQRLRAGKN